MKEIKLSFEVRIVLKQTDVQLGRRGVIEGSGKCILGVLRYGALLRVDTLKV